MEYSDKKGKKKEADIVAKAKTWFDKAETANAHNAQAWKDDFEFARLGEQWPQEVKRARDREGRPCLTINRMPAFIRQVTNDVRQNTPSIKFHAASDDASDEVAEVLDGLARNIEYTSDADVAYETALDHAVTGGFGYFRISIDYAYDDSFDKDIKIELIKNPLSVYPDYTSTKCDSSDWDHCIVTDLLTHDEFERRWPDKTPSDWSDQIDSKWFFEDSVRIAEYWCRDEISKPIFLMTDGSVIDEQTLVAQKDVFEVQGITVKDQRTTKSHKVTQYLMSGNDILETVDWPGVYIPIIPVYGDEFMFEGKRHFLSLIRHSKDSQRMFNYWRTTSTELVALAPKAPFIGAVGQFTTDANKWETANTQSHAYIEYDPIGGMPPPQRQPFAGVPAGALQEAMNASDDMKSIMGIYDASLGAKSNETSGKAILARQREGDVSTFNFIDNLSRAIRHAGRILCDLIPKVYSTERIIRVIHQDGTNEDIPINQEFMPTPNQKVGMNSGDNEQQEFAQAMAKMYDLSKGKYDVTVETGPSYTTKREEAANQMMMFMQSMPNAAPLIGDLLAKNLDWPGADDIADRLQAVLPPEVKGQNPQVMQMQQQLQQMQMASQQMQQQAQQAITQLQQQLEQEKQDKAIELAKLQNDHYNAETNRIKALNGGMTPEQIQAIVLKTIQDVFTPMQPEVGIENGNERNLVVNAD